MLASQKWIELFFHTLLPVNANRRSVSNDVTMPHGPKRSAAVEADYFGYFAYIGYI